jgi:hypothetical protein
MCHLVSGWEKMRLSSPSQSGGDMWQGRLHFSFNAQTFINYTRTPQY